MPCLYQLNPPSIPVDSYTWDFGVDAGVTTTTEPSNTVTYDQPGAYDVTVSAHAKTGAVASLTTMEVLCTGGIGAGCDPEGAPCCTGSCSAQMTCK